MGQAIALTNFELTHFFFAIVVLLIASHYGGYFFSRFKMPKVIGEIMGGLVLGPSVLGYLSPQTYDWIFNAFAGQAKLLAIMSWIGLVLLMFISGFELRQSIQKRDKKLIGAILVGATALPFMIGWLAPQYYDFSWLLGAQGNMQALALVIAIAMAVTSIPVISRIFLDLGIIQTRFAGIVLSAATVQDVILWVALAVATGLVSSQEALTHGDILRTVFITIMFFGIVLLVMPRLLTYTNTLKYNLLIKSSVSAYTLFICFFFAAIASILDVNIVFGAFLAGIVVGTLPEEKFGPVKRGIKDLSLAFFIPIYFAIVGLKLDLIHHFHIGFTVGFLLFTTLFESLGTLMAARLAKRDWSTSINFAVAMNTRGGPGIVLATVAFDMGIINEIFFVTLVLIAIVTSLAAGTWFRYVASTGAPLMR